MYKGNNIIIETAKRIGVVVPAVPPDDNTYMISNIKANTDNLTIVRVNAANLFIIVIFKMCLWLFLCKCIWLSFLKRQLILN